MSLYEVIPVGVSTILEGEEEGDNDTLIHFHYFSVVLIFVNFRFIGRKCSKLLEVIKIKI